MTTDTQEHAHRWRVAELPRDGRYPSICQDCGADKSFPLLTGSDPKHRWGDQPMVQRRKPEQPRAPRSDRKTDPSEWKHGTARTYSVRGCRCEPCRDFWREKSRRARQRALERKRNQGDAA